MAIGLFVVMPRILSKEASEVLRPNWIFAIGLGMSFRVFTYFCIFHVPTAIMDLLKGGG